MPKLPGVNHLRAVRAFQKAGFQLDRQSKHIYLSKGKFIAIIPRNNPIDPFTMAAIVRNAGITIEEFKRLL